MAFGKKLDSKYKDLIIEGVSIDTRTIQSGNLYIPIVGETFNGHEFVETAIDNGASAVLWGMNESNPPKGIPVIYVEDTLVALQNLAKNYRDELSIKVVGITGSNGKTTTKDMVTAVLSTVFRVHKTEGNLNNHIGLPLTILRLNEDTEVAVLEMGMSAFGEIEFLTKLARPDIAIITNIGESHMQDLGSRDGIAKAKLEIVDGLAQSGILIYDGDEPLLLDKVKKLNISSLTFGSTGKNDLFPTDVKLESNGTYFSINKNNGEEFYIPVLGKHNVNNATAAIAVGLHFNLSWNEIKAGLKNSKITNMRLELIEGKNGLKLINDAYNASPTSMKAAISLIQDLKGFNRKIVILADMLELGENEIKYHEEMGHLLDPTKIDYVFTFGKLGEYISKRAVERFPTGRVKAYLNKEELIAELGKVVNKDDVVLLKGSRGMKLEEVVAAFKK
nr:UDP-N-acetylmuramoyl-tripeptide--D-alanyl-D-alanine ligase [Fredinandcohnia sp. SECRCQ15]